MGIQIPPLKHRAKHSVTITFTGRLSKTNAHALKKALNRVVDRYRDKCGGGISPAKPASKRQTSS